MMKSILKRIAEETKLQEKKKAEAISKELKNPDMPHDRRNFLKKAALGGIALGGMMHLSVEDTIAQTTSKVSRASSPSDLKITDLRVAETGNTGVVSRIIRIDTNQGISGLGDIRDGTDQRFVLLLKSRIVGLNPCNPELIFKTIRQFGGHGRMGSGVGGIETAVWDICGKALGQPVWQLLGGRYRDKVRLYADTPSGKNPEDQLLRLKRRVNDEGFTWLKMDLGINSLRDTPGTISNHKFWFDPDSPGNTRTITGYNLTEHPFTQIQITDKGLEMLAKQVEAVRDVVGIEIPLCTDHFGYMDMNQFTRLARVVEKYRLAWLEDIVPWFYTEMIKNVKQVSDTPICTGEDIYMLGGMEGGFRKLIDAEACDIIHPDIINAGGILETKKIGDYAEEAGIPMAIHTNSSPIAFMAGVHCAAATENFLALEHHHTDDDWWYGLVKMTGSQPMVTKGYANVPLDAPGLGIELNDENVKARRSKGAKGYFEPTEEWNNQGGYIYDKLWI